MHGSSGIIKNFCTNRVIGLLILPLVCTGSHREFPSHGRFFTDGRFPSCMFCQTRVILFMGNVHDLTHSVFYVVHDCGCIPYPSRGRKLPLSGLGTVDGAKMHPLPLTGTETVDFKKSSPICKDASPTPHGDGNLSQFPIAQDIHVRDASPTPHGDGNAIMIPPTLFPLGCIPYPSRGRKPNEIVTASDIETDASPTPHGDGNICPAA